MCTVKLKGKGGSVVRCGCSSTHPVAPTEALVCSLVGLLHRVLIQTVL